MRAHPRLRALSPWWMLTVVAVAAAALGVGGPVFDTLKWACWLVLVLWAVEWLVGRIAARRQP